MAMSRDPADAGRHRREDAADTAGSPEAAAEAGTAFRPRLKLWVERDGHLALSAWRVALLEAVESTGSLSAAARAMKVPYRTAWYKLRQIEESLGVKLLATQSGGAEGGRSTLTPRARRLIEAFHRFSAGMQAQVDERFREHFADLLTEPDEPPP